ncbi:hypothetical protein JHK86_012275 [Glycine max]|nr:hypothetical protein JHK86_012275 [Glycine max]
MKVDVGLRHMVWNDEEKAEFYREPNEKEEGGTNREGAYWMRIVHAFLTIIDEELNLLSDHEVIQEHDEIKLKPSKCEKLEPSSQSTPGALNMENSSDEEGSDEDDELTFISRKICKMWKNNNESR